MNHKNFRRVIIEFCKPLASPIGKPKSVVFKFFDAYHNLWWNYEVTKHNIKFIGEAALPKYRVIHQFEVYVPRISKRDLITFLGKNTGKTSIKDSYHSKALHILLSGCEDSVGAYMGKYRPDTLNPCDIMEIMVDEYCQNASQHGDLHEHS